MPPGAPGPWGQPPAASCRREIGVPPPPSWSRSPRMNRPCSRRASACI